MRFAIFFLISSSIVGLAFFYVGRRLIRTSALSKRAKRYAWLTLLFWFLVPIVSFALFIRGKESGFDDAFSWVGYVSLGLFSLVFTFVVLRDAALVVWFTGRKLAAVFRRKKALIETAETDRHRRQFLVQSTNMGIIGAAVVLTGFGAYEARRRADIEEITVPLPNLPPEFDGFRILQFTDIHVGPTIKRHFVEGIAEQLDGIKADCLVFTGDLVDGSVPWLREDVAPLKELSAPHGKYFITGNHEYYSGAVPWIEEAGRLGFDVLMNEHRILQRSGAQIVLAGITDYSAGDFIPSQKSDPVGALSQAPHGLTRILLAHQPRSIFEAVKVGVDLQISGHTHGGQFFPWNHLATLNKPYIKGLHKHGKTWVYVSRGTGYWGPPLRLGVPPEITVITLARG
jgi:predicted MPP superfamily phosphohydrolase